jgi:CheY-like chemotaxis protein
MVKVLIVEDDSFKLENLHAFVTGIIKTVSITSVCDVASAVAALEENVYDLVIIDMALPSHPVVSGGGSPMSLLNGGLELLFELRYMERSDDCIVITQYPEIEISGKFFSVEQAAAAIELQFNHKVLACLQYSDEAATWKQKLSELLKKYEDSNS